MRLRKFFVTLVYTIFDCALRDYTALFYAAGAFAAFAYEAFNGTAFDYTLRVYKGRPLPQNDKEILCKAR